MKERKKEKKNPPSDRNKGSFLVGVFFLLPTPRCPTHVWAQFPKEF
jgi:hypothetical protein